MQRGNNGNSTNAQKTPMVRSLALMGVNQFEGGQQLLGKAAPATLISLSANKTIATVKVEIDSVYTIPAITCPVFGPQFIRYPLPAGTKGFLVPADFYMGGMTGLGAGTATLTRQANLAACSFFPVGNSEFNVLPFGNKLVLYGPDGAVLTDGKTEPEVKVMVDQEGNVTIWGSKSITYDCHGYGERIQWLGGASFLKTKYILGASVSEVETAYSPPEIPPI